MKSLFNLHNIIPLRILNNYLSHNYLHNHKYHNIHLHSHNILFLLCNVHDEYFDYILLDAGDKEKLENWKGIILRRPDPMAIWPKTKPEIWENCDGFYHRSHSGGGSWEFKKKLPEFMANNSEYFFLLAISFKIKPFV